MLFLLLLAVGGETPQVRHARLMREAAQGFAPLLKRDAAREADLTQRVEQDLATTSPWQRWIEEISPHALAGLGVAAVGLSALSVLVFVVARPTVRPNRA